MVPFLAILHKFVVIQWMYSSMAWYVAEFPAILELSQIPQLIT